MHNGSDAHSLHTHTHTWCTEPTAPAEDKTPLRLHSVLFLPLSSWYLFHIPCRLHSLTLPARFIPFPFYLAELVSFYTLFTGCMQSTPGSTCLLLVKPVFIGKFWLLSALWVRPIGKLSPTFIETQTVKERSWFEKHAKTQVHKHWADIGCCHVHGHTHKNLVCMAANMSKCKTVNNSD